MKHGFVAACSLLLAACAGPQSMYPTLTAQEVEREQRIQRQIVEQQGTASEMGEVQRQPRHVARVEDVAPKVKTAALRLCQEMGIAKNACDFNFTVLEDGPVNAYADGKTIHITPAMVDVSDENQKLAFVLAHEYAHNLMRHVQATQQNIGLGAITGLLLDKALESQGLSTGGNLSKLGQQFALLRYSKKFEQEADYVGMYILARAGYDISSVADVRREASVRNPQAIYMATTHPTNPERFIALNKAVEEIEAKQRAGRPLIPAMRPDA